MDEPEFEHPHHLNIIEEKESENDEFDSELFESLGEEIDIKEEEEFKSSHITYENLK